MDLELFDQTAGVKPEWLTLIKDILAYAGKVLALPEETQMSVTLMDNAQIQAINKEYRGVNKPTDVISFAIQEDDEEEAPIIMPDGIDFDEAPNLGDIMVSVDKVKDQAKMLGHSEERELGFLCVHGFLHLNGYDHMQPEDEQRMFALQDKILTGFGLVR